MLIVWHLSAFMLSSWNKAFDGCWAGEKKSDFTKTQTDVSRRLIDETIVTPVNAWFISIQTMILTLSITLIYFLWACESQINFPGATHLLKCVFLLRLSSILGCSFPICSSSFERVLLRFFLSIFWACSLSCLLCRRLLKKIETLRSSTVPLVKPSMVRFCCCFSWFLSLSQLFVVVSLCFQRNSSLFVERKGNFVQRKREVGRRGREEKFFHFSFGAFVIKQKEWKKSFLCALMPRKL